MKPAAVEDRIHFVFLGVDSTRVLGCSPAFGDVEVLDEMMRSVDLRGNLEGD